jgi:hypothetical protein
MGVTRVRQYIFTILKFMGETAIHFRSISNDAFWHPAWQRDFSCVSHHAPISRHTPFENADLETRVLQSLEHLVPVNAVEGL